MPRIKCSLSAYDTSLRTFLWFFPRLVGLHWLVKARTSHTLRHINTHTPQQNQHFSLTKFHLSFATWRVFFLRMSILHVFLIPVGLARSYWMGLVWGHSECLSKLPVTMLISSSWLRWLEELSDRLELAELKGWSEGQGDGGPPLFINRENVW